MYNQKYARLISLLPDCVESDLSKSLRWFQIQLKSVPGYSAYTVINPCFKWGDEIIRVESKSHLCTSEQDPYLGVILRIPCYFVTQPVFSQIPI